MLYEELEDYTNDKLSKVLNILEKEFQNKISIDLDISLQHRDEFNRMIEDCKVGKIDLIVTKSVSRFARNIVDCIAKVRELANMKPQVGVFFETEHIYTLDNTSEMMLAVLSACLLYTSRNVSAELLIDYLIFE